MKRINAEEIKCVLMQPERLPEIQRKLMEYLYESYMRYLKAEK